MSFLSIAFLFALPLMAAPLLLHFFDRRRKSVIHWGAMQFLTEASAKKTSARRLKQWLLLAMRVLAIGLLIIALARPLAPAGLLGGNARTETIFLVDNSMSMGREANGLSHLARAIDEITSELSMVTSSDQVRVMTTAPYPSWTTASDSVSDAVSRNQLLDQLSAIQVIGGSSDMLSALSIVAQEAVDPTVSDRRIVIFTDGQAVDWQTHDEAGWNRLQETLASSTIPVDVDIRNVHPSSETTINNLAVDELNIRRSIVAVGQPVTLSARIRNHGGVDANDVSLTWKMNGDDGNLDPISDTEDSSDTIDVVEVEQSVESLWNHQFDQPGRYRVTAHVDHDDEMAGDNQDSIVVEVVDRIPVVVVEESFELAELQQDAYFVQTALGWLDGQSLGANSIYEPTIVSLQELATLDLRDQRVVVIPNLTRLDDDLLEHLSDFVRDGGGLWLALGSRTDLQWFNQKLFAEASGPSPIGIRRIADFGTRVNDESDSDASDESGEDPDDAATSAMVEDRTVRIDPFRDSHAATRQLTDENQSDLGETRVERWFQFDGLEEHDDLSRLLSLDNGEPLAVENLLGQGRVIVQAIPLRLQWSDLARKQSFVVMVRDWIDYLAEPRAARFNLQPGEPIVLAVDESQAGSDLAQQTQGPPTGLLTTPSGEVLELAAVQGDRGNEFRTSRTRVPGAYALEVGLSNQAIPFQVHRDSSESNLKRLNEDATENLNRLTNPPRSEPANIGVANQHSDPVWPFLLIALIGLLTAELVLSGVLAKERFGVAGVASHADLDGQFPITDTVTPTSVETMSSSLQSSSREAV